MPRPAQKRKAALLDQSGDGASTSPNDSRSTTDDVSPSPLPSTYPFRSSSPPKPARSTSSVPSQTSPNDSRSTTDDVSPSPLLSTYPSRSSSPPKPARNTSSVLSQASPLKQTSSLMSMSDVQHALASISPELIKLLRPEERNVLAKLVSRTTGNVIRGHDLLTIAEQAEPRPVKKQAEECLKRYVELLERQFDPTRRSLEELAKPVAEERTVADQKPTAKTTTRDTTTAKGEDKKPPRKSIISNPTDIAVLPDNPKREVLCISRPMSRHVVLSAAEQEALDDMTAPDYHQALNTAGISYGSLRTTYRCGSAAVPAYMWVNNQPTNRHTIDQPPQWLQNAAAGFSDVLVLDGLTALSTNVGLLMPVLATIGQLGGVIVVLNIDGPASVYSAQGFFDALEMLGDWLEGVVAYHGPGGMGPGDDPDHTAEATSMLVAATVLRRQSFASPEANAARRVVLGYLSRRRTSLINRQTFGEAVGEDGRSDARRWKKSRGALCDVLKPKTLRLGDDQDDDGEGDLDAQNERGRGGEGSERGGESATGGSGARAGGSSGARSSSAAPTGYSALYRHASGWCTNCHEFQRTSFVDGVETCSPCRANPDRADRGGISGREEPTPNPTRQPSQLLNREFGGCENPRCSLSNSTNARLSVVDGVRRCKGCHQFFLANKRENPHPVQRKTVGSFVDR